MRRHDLCGFILGLFLVFTTIQSSMAQVSQDPVRISEIRVDGNRRVAAGTVQSYLPVRVGDLTSPGSLSNALARLYDTNLFQDIKLDMDGSVLIVSVVENPIINRVNIEGNDVISDERLLEIIDVQPRRVYNQKVAIDATRQLIDVYRAGGRFAAVIEPKIIQLDENRVDLVFEVNEGPLIKINSIAFSGNKSFSQLDATYVGLAADEAENRDVPLSSLALKWNYQFLPDWRSTSEFQFDTSIGEASKFEFGLEYANECVIVDFSASRRFATSATLTDKTEFGLSVALAGFSTGVRNIKKSRQCGAS